MGPHPNLCYDRPVRRAALMVCVSLLVTAFLVNGAWGIGTALILKALSAWFEVPHDKKD